jgi:hypothetical protein
MKLALNNILIRLKLIFYQRFSVDQVLKVYLLLWNKLNILSHLHRKIYVCLFLYKAVS